MLDWCLIGCLELELHDRGTDFTATCCNTEIILTVVLELPGIFTGVSVEFDLE